MGLRFRLGLGLVLMVAMAACSAVDEMGEAEEIVVVNESETAAVPSTPMPSEPEPALLLPDLGPAPDITNEVWLNSEIPLNLEAVRGRVVLVEFWTFG